MITTLALSLVLSQTIYEWVDSKGETHFTDDPTTIPAKVKPKVTVMEMSDAGSSSVKVLGPSEMAPEVPEAADTPSKCELARARFANLEALLATAKREADAAQKQRGEACQAHLRVNDRARYATCIAAAQGGGTTDFAALERQLAEAREALRRVQVGGCH